jgi:WD40 repeat protein
MACALGCGPREIMKIDTGCGIASLGLLADERYVLVANGDGAIGLWDLQSRQLVKPFPGSTRCSARVAVSADGKLAVCAGQDGVSRLVAPESEAVVFQVQSESMGYMALSADGRYLAVADYDETTCFFRIFDTATRRQVQRTPPAPSLSVWGVALSADGKRLAGVYINRVVVWDTATNRQLHDLPARFQATNAVFSPDGRLLLVGDWQGVRVCEVDTGASRWMADGWWALDMAFSSDGRIALAGGYDNTLIVWDTRTWAELGRFGGGRQPLVLPGAKNSVSAVACTRDGRRAITGSTDGSIRVWDLAGVRATLTPAGTTGTGSPVDSPPSSSAPSTQAAPASTNGARKP